MYKRIRFGTTSTGTEEIDILKKCLDSGFVSPGELTKEFENKIASIHGYKYGVACNSGGSAILVATLAAREIWHLYTIAVPAITYIQSIAPLVHAGYKVKLVDVMPNPHVEPLWGWADDIDAYLPCHILGRASRMRPPNHLIAIEDCAESIYAEGVGFGMACCLSFNSTHLITTGAGGMILTNNKEFRDKCWTLINHGRPEDRSQASCAELENHYIFTDWGFSFKFSDIQAAVGLAQHEKRESIIRRRRGNAQYLIDNLKDVQQIQLPLMDGNTFMAFQIVTNDDSREALRKQLHEANIETRPLFPIITQPIVQDWFDIKEGEFPGAELINRRGFFFGCHQNLVTEDLDRIIGVIRNFYGV